MPVLDERENLDLAEAIFNGTLPAEPFYRAPGYALLLATLRGLGVSAAGLFPAALIFGAILHAINAGLVARLARKWFGVAAGVLAGLLAALHPVFVHYSTQALDAAPALTLLLLGLNFFAAAETGGDLGAWFGASMSWAAAALMRPNYLLVWVALPIIAVTKLGSAAGAKWPRALAALGGAGLFVALAGWQWRIAGTPGFLPTQGPYNFWAANEPGAHGRYYVQHFSLPANLARQNPARAETFLRFEQETGRAPRDLAEANAYWRQRTVAELAGHPFAWLGRLARKTYALLNDWEQYNNKTFAFHQARSPWLRWNPLSWGLLLVLGTAGFARLAIETPRTAAALAAVTGTLAASVILFFVSARFRLPLAALLCVTAGGALGGHRFWWTWPRSRQLALGAMLIAVTALTFSNFGGVRDTTTFVQDHALLARAAATVGDDALADDEAHLALALSPSHPDALRLAVVSYFNELLVGNAPPSAAARWTLACRQLLAGPVSDAPDLRAVAALALWRVGDASAALAEWRSLATNSSAVAARALVHDAPIGRSDVVAFPVAAWSQPLVRLAAAQFNVPPPPGANITLPTDAPAIIARLLNASATK